MAEAPVFRISRGCNDPSQLSMVVCEIGAYVPAASKASWGVVICKRFISAMFLLLRTPLLVWCLEGGDDAYRGVQRLQERFVCESPVTIHGTASLCLRSGKRYTIGLALGRWSSKL